jgi:lipoate-protein ligase A
MAVDEAILRAVVAGLVPPTLRLYAWEPGCLSLGRSQTVADVDASAVQETGYDLVRRPTGGKAVLHVDELTYSVVAPAEEPRLAGPVVESYRRVSAGIVRGLERLGVAGVAVDRRADGNRPAGPVCFEVPSDYEIALRGRKLVGSAQMRVQGGVLQHGALPLYGDVARICPLLASRPDPGRVRARATTLMDVSELSHRQSAVSGGGAAGTRGQGVQRLGQAPPQSQGAGECGDDLWAAAARALVAGFAEALHLRFEEGALTTEELAWAEDLRVTKYGTGAWTRRV